MERRKATSPVIGSANGQRAVFTGTQLLTGAEQRREHATQLGSSSSTAHSRTSRPPRRQKQTLDQVQQEIEQAAEQLGLGGKVQTKTLNNGLDVTLLTDKVLFDERFRDAATGGRSAARRDRRDRCSTIDNPIIIDGYTDNVPIHDRAVPVEPVPVVGACRRGR